MTENEIARQIVDASYAIHTALGPGLLESVYTHALEAELRMRGLRVEREVAIGVTNKDIKLAMGFRADLIVEGKVIVELKLARNSPESRRQNTAYLPAADKSSVGAAH